MFLLASRLTLRSRLPTQSQSLASSLTRHYATAAKKSPSSVRLPPSPLSSRSTPASRSSLPTLPSSTLGRTGRDALDTSTKSMKVLNAKQLFEAGQTLLYLAPRRLKMFRFVSWTIGGLCIASVFAFGAQRIWDIETVRARGLGSWIAITYQICMLFLTAMGALAINRTSGFISRIDLVKKAELVLLQVSVRKVLPFTKPQRMFLTPYNFQVDRTVVRMAENPKWVQPVVGDSKDNIAVRTLRGVSRFFFGIFEASRQVFTQEGVVKVTAIVQEASQDGKEKEKSSKLNLDLYGDFAKFMEAPKPMDDRRADLLHLATWKD